MRMNRNRHNAAEARQRDNLVQRRNGWRSARYGRIALVQRYWRGWIGASFQRP